MTDKAPVSRTSLLTEWGIRSVLAVLLVAFLAIWQPGILGGALNSTRAVAFIALVFLVAVGLEWWLRRRGAQPLWWRGAFYVIMGIAVGVGVLPAYYSTTVTETESATFRDAQPVPTQTTGATPAGPVELGRAELAGIDHRASGTVRVARDKAGRIAVRFEDLDVEPGPDYYIWVVPGNDKEGTDKGIQLGRIKANKGDQEYASSEKLALDRPITVLIWCRAFATPIGNATIA
ncbi:MAG: DM13 domain-containing protein [Mycobacteriales bacterium]